MKNVFNKAKLLLLSIILAFSPLFMPISAYGEDAVKTNIIMTCDKQNINVGETVTITIQSDMTANILGVQYQMNYDTTKLDLLGNGMTFPGSIMPVDTTGSGVTVDKNNGILIYPLLNITNKPNLTTEIAQVKFTALKTGTTDIILSSIKAVDEKLNVINNNNSYKITLNINAAPISPTQPSNVVPAAISVDGSSNVTAAISASSINSNSKNIVQVQEPSTVSTVKVSIPANSMISGTGSVEIKTNTVLLDIPMGVVDSSLLSSGQTLQVTKGLLSDSEAQKLLVNIPQGAKSNGKVFSLGMNVCDSNNNVLSRIHNFSNNKSVTITINMSDEDITGMDTSNIAAYYFDTETDSWVEIGGTYNSVNKTFNFSTTHFSNFTIMQKSGSNIVRLGGMTRVETSLQIAKYQFADKKPDAVVLATADNFPDAVVGSGLAYKYNAPLLLVNNTVSDSKDVLDYISANLTKDKKIYILGGTGAVSSQIFDYLNAQGYSVTRFAGKDRYDTNQKIVDYMNVSKGTPLVIATGSDFADALSISSVADIKGYSVLLNAKDNLSNNVSNYITNVQPTEVYIIGGTGVLSVGIEDQINKLNENIKIVRLGGKGRYETSIQIADYFKLNSSIITAAIGTNFPDALSGSVLAARKNSSVLLIDNSNVTKQKDLLNRLKITNIIIFGGESVISSSTANSLVK